jgi:hypothetical protein
MPQTLTTIIWILSVSCLLFPVVKESIHLYKGIKKDNAVIREFFEELKADRVRKENENSGSN